MQESVPVQKTVQEYMRTAFATQTSSSVSGKPDQSSPSSVSPSAPPDTDGDQAQACSRSVMRLLMLSMTTAWFIIMVCISLRSAMAAR